MNPFITAVAIGAILALGMGLAYKAYPLDTAGVGYASTPYVHLHDTGAQQTRVPG